MKNNGKVTIANFIAIAGFVVLTIFYFLGKLYLEKGAWVKTILLTLAFLCLSSGVLFFLIKVKGVENDFKKWRIVEYVLFAGYIVVAASFSLGFVHFFSIGSTDALKETGKRDIKSIENMFSIYERFETDAISTTRYGLMNTLGASLSDELKEFMSEKKILANMQSISDFCEIQDSILLGKTYRNFKNQVMSGLEDYETVIDQWNTFGIAFYFNDIQELSCTVAETLGKFSGSSKVFLPQIERRNGVMTIVKENQRKEFPVPTMALPYSLGDFKGSIIGWILYVICHLCVLMNYFVAYRSDVIELTRPKKK